MKKILFTAFFAACALAISAQAFTYNGKTLETITTFVKQSSSGSTTTATKEVSGLAASRTTTGYFWANCDDFPSGEEGYIYALNPNGSVKLKLKTGVSLKRDTWSHEDWEDICMATFDGQNYIIVGAIGDNAKDKGTYYLYVIPEPVIGNTSPVTASNVATITFQYPGGAKHNAESVMYDPIDNLIIVVNKDTDTGKKPTGTPSKVYTTPFSTISKTITLAEVATLGGGISENNFFAATAADMSQDGMYALIKCDNNNDNSSAKSVASVLYWERACATESFTDMITRAPKYVTAYLKNDDQKGEAIAWSLDGKSFTTASDASTASAMNLYTRPSAPIIPAFCETLPATPSDGDASECTIAGGYWINQSMNSTSAPSNWGNANLTIGNICVIGTRIRTESVPGNAKDALFTYSNVISLDGVDAATPTPSIEFTVPNAGKIRIYVAAKSANQDRFAKIEVTGKDAVYLAGLDKDNGRLYEVTHNSPTPLTIKITGYTATSKGGTIPVKSSGDPICIHSIQVEKYNPTINVSTTSLSGFGYAYGESSSAVKTFILSGTQLTADNITVSLPANSKYEISKSSSSDYAQSLTFKDRTDNSMSQQVYVRIKTGQDAGDYNETVTISTLYNTVSTTSCSSTVASRTTTATLSCTDTNITLSGEVIAPLLISKTIKWTEATINHAAKTITATINSSAPGFGSLSYVECYFEVHPSVASVAIGEDIESAITIQSGEGVNLATLGLTTGGTLNTKVFLTATTGSAKSRSQAASDTYSLEITDNNDGTATSLDETNHNKQLKSENCFTITGVKVPCNTQGIIIKQKTYIDGSTGSLKILND